MTTEEIKKSSESPSPASFSSLPYDIVLNCLARISRIHHPTLSLVSKTFRSIIASRDLDATRSRISKTENRLYVCLDLNNNNRRWLTLSVVPEKQRLIQIPSLFPCQHSKSSSVISTGSKIYVIGGFVNGKRSKKVFLLDCKSHQWRRVAKMRVPRKEPALDVINGKIYVIGGCESENDEDWGEVYDPKMQTWEPLSPTMFDLNVQKSLGRSGKFVMGGKVYDMNLNLYLNHICLVKIENVLYQTAVYLGDLVWYDSKEWKRVDGLERLPNSAYLTSITSFGDGRRVMVWWKSLCETVIFCAEISFERRGLGKLWGTVEWLKDVFTLKDEGESSGSDFFWHYATVTH